jgi:hypothetical protein
MSSTDRKLELKAKTSVAQTATSQVAVYAKGLKQKKVMNVYYKQAAWGYGHGAHSLSPSTRQTMYV